MDQNEIIIRTIYKGRSLTRRRLIRLIDSDKSDLGPTIDFNKSSAVLEPEVAVLNEAYQLQMKRNKDRPPPLTY